MTPEEMQQIQTIIQAAVAPITTRLDGLEKGQKNLENRLGNVEAGQKILEQVQQTLRSEVQASEQKVIAKLDTLEKLAADYLDGQVQLTKRRLDRIEQHLHLTP